MKKLNYETVTNWLNARHHNERVILLAGVLGLLVMTWMTLVHGALVVAQETEARSIAVTDSLIVAEQTRQGDIRNTYTNDPNNFALSRQRELREATEAANARLNGLYGELISPQQMSQLLTAILQNDTRLKLVSLENTPSEVLVNSVVAADGEVSDEVLRAGVQVFKHGFRMVFEGNYLETIRYLRSLEELDGNFFWDSLDFDLAAYPNGRITLDIYTLSTEEGWIGV
jgi:MSHA biogenesis protein MshJ